MNNHLVALFAGEAAGHYALPDEVLKAHRGVARIEEGRLAASVEWRRKSNLEASAKQMLLDEIIRAASEGADLPDAASILDARREQEIIQIKAQAFESAMQEAGSDLDALVTKNADEIARCLDEALQATLKAARERSGDLDGIELVAEIAIASGEQGIAAWNDLNGLSDRFAAIRAGQGFLIASAGRRTKDVHGYFNEFRNPDRFERNADRLIERLVAIATSEAGAWVPTAAQQNEAVRIWQESNDPVAKAQRAALDRAGERVTAP